VTEKKIRIAHFIETDIPGGAEQVLLDLCQYINKQSSNIECVLITFEHPWFKKQCNARNIKYIEAPFRDDFKRTITLPIFAWKFGRWLKKQNIDLLHSHLFGPITGGAIAAFIAGIPHVGTLHDVYMISEKPSRIRLIQLAALLKTKLVTVSNDMENFYKQSGYFSPTTFSTIYNGVEVVTTNNTLRSDLNLTEQYPTIICVGRLIPLKQVEELTKVILALLKKHNFYFLIVGEGPERKKIEAIAEQSQAHIKMLGERNDIPNLLALSDIFIQYSTTEGLSRSIIEAISTGLPCIVSNVGGNPEIVKDGYNGELVNENDSKTLNNALSRLLEDETLRAEYSKNSIKYAQDNFGLEANNRKYLNLYNSLV